MAEIYNFSLIANYIATDCLVFIECINVLIFKQCLFQCVMFHCKKEIILENYCI